VQYKGFFMGKSPFHLPHQSLINKHKKADQASDLDNNDLCAGNELLDLFEAGGLFHNLSLPGDGVRE
jgi:hypothetical protein